MEKFKNSLETPKTPDRAKLEKLLQGVSEYLKNKEGVPVDQDCRLDPWAFQGIYSEQEIKEDQLKAEQHKNLAESQESKTPADKESQMIGEVAEELTTIVWNKVLRDKFVTVRTTLYDDTKNGVDHIIIEKSTGKTICAIDDVSAITGFTLSRKKIRAQEIMKRGGATLKYGLVVDKNKRFSLARWQKELPYFYLPLAGSEVDKLVAEINDSTQETSETEKKLVAYQIQVIREQVKEQQKLLRNQVVLNSNQAQKLNKIAEIFNDQLIASIIGSR